MSRFLRSSFILATGLALVALGSGPISSQAQGRPAGTSAALQRPAAGGSHQAYRVSPRELAKATSSRQALGTGLATRHLTPLLPADWHVAPPAGPGVADGFPKTPMANGLPK